MGKLTGAKSINTANGVRRGNLFVHRDGSTGRIATVSLSIEGIGYVSFAHVHAAHAPGLNAAQRLEALRGQACPMSAVRVRRYERGAENDVHAETAGV